MTLTPLDSSEPPPSYEQAVRLFTISGSAVRPSPQNASKLPLYEELYGTVPHSTNETRATRSGPQTTRNPPHLLGLATIETPFQQVDSTNELVACHSSPASTNRFRCCLLSKCCQQSPISLPTSSQESNKSCGSILLMTLAVAAALSVCVAMIYIGTSTQDILCRGSHFIQNAMKMSGVAGIPTLIMIFFLMACSKKGREKIVAKLKVFATFLLFTCAIFYWAGTIEAFRVWQSKPCNPFGASRECLALFKLYCDVTLAKFSFAAYTSLLVILSPVWLLILGVIVTMIIKKNQA